MSSGGIFLFLYSNILSINLLPNKSPMEQIPTIVIMLVSIVSDRSSIISIHVYQVPGIMLNTRFP
jgi:hypothetical protein